MKAKVITIANHKGGVGKTTSAASVGCGLALKGKRVLLVDLDAQQNLSFTLTREEDPEASIYDALVKDEPLPIVKVTENVDLVPSSLELARAEIDMATKIAREGILRSLLEEYADSYDFIIIDCPPSLGIVTTNALVASAKGLTMLDDVVREVRKRVNPNLELGAVFFTRYNNRKLNKEVVTMIENRYGDKVFKTKIRENIALAEMPLSGKSIFEYDRRSNGAKDYMALVEEILERECK